MTNLEALKAYFEERLYDCESPGTKRSLETHLKICQNAIDEHEYLTWFVQNADFGPADGDVRQHLRQQYVTQTGKPVPEGWDNPDDEEEYE